MRFKSSPKIIFDEGTDGTDSDQVRDWCNASPDRKRDYSGASRWVIAGRGCRTATGGPAHGQSPTLCPSVLTDSLQLPCLRRLRLARIQYVIRAPSS